MRYDYKTLDAFPSRPTETAPWARLTFWITLTYVLLIGGVEVFWYFFAGGVSPLLGLFAFTAATFVAVRMIGDAVVARMRLF